MENNCDIIVRYILQLIYVGVRSSRYMQVSFTKARVRRKHSSSSSSFRKNHSHTNERKQLLQITTHVVRVYTDI